MFPTGSMHTQNSAPSFVSFLIDIKKSFYIFGILKAKKYHVYPKPVVLPLLKYMGLADISKESHPYCNFFYSCSPGIR